jgi:hypothetical protein
MLGNRFQALKMATISWLSIGRKWAQERRLGALQHIECRMSISMYRYIDVASPSLSLVETSNVGKGLYIFSDTYTMYIPSMFIFHLSS